MPPILIDENRRIPFISIHLNLCDTLLVECRHEPYTRTDMGPDGTPAKVETK